MENVHGPFGIEGTFNAISVLFMKPPPRFAASQEVLRRRIVVKREKQANKAASQQEGWYEKAGEIGRRFSSSEHLDAHFLTSCFYTALLRDTSRR